mmetsp:Transcript_79370/g.220852  ORF Transcript_79370/g.220852 Transcript_79370/m.220852 type:complete len:200 (-) Transcript_79370:118-717(-)
MHPLAAIELHAYVDVQSLHRWSHEIVGAGGGGKLWWATTVDAHGLDEAIAYRHVQLGPEIRHLPGRGGANIEEPQAHSEAGCVQEAHDLLAADRLSGLRPQGETKAVTKVMHVPLFKNGEGLHKSQREEAALEVSSFRCGLHGEIEVKMTDAIVDRRQQLCLQGSLLIPREFQPQAGNINAIGMRQAPFRRPHVPHETR